MPLLAVNLSDKLFTDIKPLVEKGLYQSFESFIEIAAFNQLALERGASPSEIVETGHRRVRREPSNNGTKPATNVTENQNGATPKTSRPSASRRPVQVAGKIETEELNIPEEDYTATFKRLGLVKCSLNSPSLTHPDADHLAGERVFGQVNRLLPLKLACRWLATNAATEGKWSKYDTISDRLADDAATIGSLLERWDNETSRKRDELLATGLPRRGNSASRDRFLSQFLARVTRGGEVYPGAVCQYQLARFEDSAIVLTDRGIGFAGLENPILDKQDSKTPSTLAQAESEFLTCQVLEWVPAEREDMRVVLQAVLTGKATPTDLTKAVRSHFPADWSESVFQTHLSGLIARLGELRLVRRSWQGRNVQYEIGDQQQVESFVAGGVLS